ncbi:hypothetical protein [Halobacterium rubrum]|uniref:hypothetical protein n=1 Tax=Halobacterium rubrum TaxID=1341552 RepID=UPI0024540AD8|nr:hypothetical protein [Halobacterium rubrum]MDH5018789.1 hypothetical protein [Halobacterium rubrum]
MAVRTEDRRLLDFGVNRLDRTAVRNHLADGRRLFVVWVMELQTHRVSFTAALTATDLLVGVGPGANPRLLVDRPGSFAEQTCFQRVPRAVGEFGRIEFGQHYRCIVVFPPVTVRAEQLTVLDFRADCFSRVSGRHHLVDAQPFSCVVDVVEVEAERRRFRTPNAPGPVGSVLVEPLAEPPSPVP